MVVKRWSKDILYQPVDYHIRSQELHIHQGSTRVQLAKVGLIGKELLSSAMTEADIGAEIWSLFSMAFDEEKNFTIKFLLIDNRGWITVPGCPMHITNLPVDSQGSGVPSRERCCVHFSREPNHRSQCYGL